MRKRRAVRKDGGGPPDVTARNFSLFEGPISQIKLRKFGSDHDTGLGRNVNRGKDCVGYVRRSVIPFFDSLSYTHRKEYCRWITEAKKEETRLERLEKAVDMFRNGVRTSGQPTRLSAIGGTANT